MNKYRIVDGKLETSRVTYLTDNRYSITYANGYSCTIGKGMLDDYYYNTAKEAISAYMDELQENIRQQTAILHMWETKLNDMNELLRITPENVMDTDDGTNEQY